MARASMCAELPTFTSAPVTPVPESPLVVEHRSVSVDGDFTVPLLNAASLHRPEGEAPDRLPNGFRPPAHHRFPSASAGSSSDNLFEVIAVALCLFPLLFFLNHDTDCDKDYMFMWTVGYM